MKQTLIQTSLAAAVLLATLILHTTSSRAQGALTPPGAPAPTMKTLSEIEARTPVDAINTPGTALIQYVISQPGSYYLTGNLVGATNQFVCINIQASDVVLDLNGYELLAATNIADGITISGFGPRNVVIRNGSLRNWLNGIIGETCDAGELDHVRAYGCVLDGFYLRNNWTITHCTALGCANGAGMQVGDGCMITDCLLSSNYDGIYGGKGCLISGCLAAANSYDGFVLTDDYNVSKSTSYSSGHNGFTLGKSGQIRDCTANTNSASGISALVFCQVRGCTANANSNGIVVADNSVVADNQAAGNGNSGMTSSGTGSRLEGNQTPNNAINGILSVGGNSADIIVRNTSTGNGQHNYMPATSTTEGPLQTPALATSPWANF